MNSDTAVCIIACVFFICITAIFITMILKEPK